MLGCAPSSIFGRECSVNLRYKNDYSILSTTTSISFPYDVMEIWSQEEEILSEIYYVATNVLSGPVIISETGRINHCALMSFCCFVPTKEKVFVSCKNCKLSHEDRNLVFGNGAYHSISYNCKTFPENYLNWVQFCVIKFISNYRSTSETDTSNIAWCCCNVQFLRTSKKVMLVR